MVILHVYSFNKNYHSETIVYLFCICFCVHIYFNNNRETSYKQQFRNYCGILLITAFLD